jgi:predicted nucleic acid-binding protein
MLLDSNIIIYAADPAHEWLRIWLENRTLAASSLTRVEVLGYHGLTPSVELRLRDFFSRIQIHALSEMIADRAIRLRQERKMGLADSVIAATAIENGLPLVTRNHDDFRHVAGLELINPFDTI